MKVRGVLIAVVLLVLVFATPASAARAVQPDGIIRSSTAATFRGDGVYNRDGARQTSELLIGARGVADFYIGVQNDGRATDAFTVSGSNHTRRFSVRYFLGAREVSVPVKAGRFELGPVDGGDQEVLRVRIATRVAVPRGTAFTVTVSARSGSSGNIDVTRARVVRPLYSAAQVQVRQQINASRAAHGLRGLSMNVRLADKAQAWAQHLAAIGRLEHSDLASDVPSNWRALAENVGYYTSLAGVHQEFMNSSHHRANVLGPYTQVGTGVATRGQWFYVVHVFMRT